MEAKFCLNLAPKKNYVVSQGVNFPLAILRTEPIFINWYYSNYIMPIAALDGVNSLWIRVADSLTYGDYANIYNKIMRMSSVHLHFCIQIEDIVDALKNQISKDKEYYCILFLDFYYLQSLDTFYKQRHYVHELLFYGYDDTKKCFDVYGYIGTSYKYINLSYTDVRNAFQSAFKYVADGWNKHMLMTLKPYYHAEGYNYPYPNKKVINKLMAYVASEASEEFKCDNLMYLKTSDSQIYKVGIEITDIMCEYVLLLCDSLTNNISNEQFSSQQNAFNMYKAFHIDIFERMAYLAKVNEIESQLNKHIEQYYQKVVKPSELIRILYIKLGILINRKLPVIKVLNHMIMCLKMIKENETLIINRYLDVVIEENLPDEILARGDKYFE